MVAGKGEDGPTVDPQVNDADTSGLVDVSKLPMNTISDSILGQSAAKRLLSAEAFENEFLEFPPVELLHEQELVDADTLYMMPPSGCQSHLQLPGLACVPIVALHFSHDMMAKRCLVLVLATGLLFILIQPPIALSWTYHSELLIATILLTIAALTSIIPIKYIVALRIFYSISMGIALGIYISAEYFLQAAILHALIVVTMVRASVFVIFTNFPSASSTKVLPWVFALLVALFPVTYLLEGQVRIKSLLAESGVGDVGEDESKLTTLVF
ncbi:hypothetical protein POM88_027519 [Heracleum sosnowskyi]|uniref:Uncharacterized protein n=1 Tax=Heracleum sosnowskyi TaxID=360622 RepID=A0AAD8MLJ8_9APIA|nr:hypothetical protein POM88_027519 [Heracleum sosnowskyi]